MTGLVVGVRVPRGRGLRGDHHVADAVDRPGHGDGRVPVAVDAEQRVRPRGVLAVLQPDLVDLAARAAPRRGARRARCGWRRCAARRCRRRSCRPGPCGRSGGRGRRAMTTMIAASANAIAGAERERRSAEPRAGRTAASRRRARCERERRGRRPERLGRGPGLVLDRVHHPALELRRGLDAGTAIARSSTTCWKARSSTGQTAQLCEVAAERLRLGGLERAERVRGDVGAAGVLVPRPGVSSSGLIVRPPPWGRSRETRNLVRPRRIRPLTVPAGRSSIDEISVWLKPPK